MIALTCAATHALADGGSLEPRGPVDSHSQQPLATPHSPALAAPGAASSPGTDPEPPSYRAAADLGFEEFRRGNYIEARARFTEAHRLWPNARSLRALGYCEYELKNYVQSLALLQQALASSVRPLSDEQRRETKELIGRARGYVARYELRTVPRHAALTIDGVEPTLDAQGGVTLSVGAHVLEVFAPGYQTRRRELSVEGNADRVIAVDLVPVQLPASAQPKEPLRKKWWVWTSAIAVVGAGITAGLVAGLHDPGTSPVTGGGTGIKMAVRKQPGEP